MNFPFSIIGTFIYLTYVSLVLVVVVLPLWKWLLKNKSWKWWLIVPISLPLLIAPIAEELWITNSFNTICQDAGIHVERRVEVAGYYDSSKNDPSTKNKIIDESSKVKRLLNEGFRYKEVKTSRGKVRHREIIDGKIEQTIIDKPQARYFLMKTYDHSKVGHQLEKSESVIFDNLKKESIGRDTTYARYPGWIEGMWIQFIGKGQIICQGPIEQPDKHKRIGQINKYVLIPNRDLKE